MDIRELSFYMLLFDKSSDGLVQKFGITLGTIAAGLPTLIASRVFISHRKELMENEEWEIWSGIMTVNPQYLTIIHRIVCNNVVRVTYNIRAYAFYPHTRVSKNLSEDTLTLDTKYIISEMVDQFERYSR